MVDIGGGEERVLLGALRVNKTCVSQAREAKMSMPCCWRTFGEGGGEF